MLYCYSIDAGAHAEHRKHSRKFFFLAYTLFLGQANRLRGCRSTSAGRCALYIRRAYKKIYF